MCSQNDDPSQHDVLRTANYAPGFVPTQKIDALIAERDTLRKVLDRTAEVLDLWLWSADELTEDLVRSTVKAARAALGDTE